jgi:hypothetical protein
VGNYVLYSVYTTSYKKEFKHYISNHKENTRVTTLLINPGELYCNSARITWEDDNKEIVHEGVLYDIVTIAFNGLTVKLTVVSDKQEMELKKQFASLYDADSHSATKTPFSILKLFLFLKYIPNTDSLELKALETDRVHDFTFQEFKLRHNTIPTDSPPPDLFL